jgi:hypothetical protein
MDDLVSAAESLPNGPSDRPLLAFVVFGLSFFLAFVIWLAPVRKS